MPSSVSFQALSIVDLVGKFMGSGFKPPILPHMMIGKPLDGFVNF
jgi:hypothetical protein